MWVRKPEYKDFFLEGVDRYVRSRFLNKVEDFQSKSKQWQRDHFENLLSKTKELREKLSHIQQGPPTPIMLQKKKNVSTKLEELLATEESFWHPKAKSQLPKKGDKNTKFFHVVFTNRN